MLVLHGTSCSTNMINNFLKYLTYEKRASELTLTSYRNDLFQFQSFLLSYTETPIEQCSALEIRAWIVTLVEQSLHARTVNRKIAALRSFYKFLQKRGIITQNPTLKIKALRTPQQLPAFIKEKEMQFMLDHTLFVENFNGQRDLVMLEFLYGTGTRLSELIHLKDTDIDLAQGSVKVLGKRKKERVIPISKSLKEVVKSYMDLKKNQFGDVLPPYFLVTEEGKPCYPMLIYRVVKKYLEACSTAEKKSPHVLRHTYATHLLDKGADLNAVKELLGHANLAATQVYTHVSLDKLKAAFDQAHPKAK
jgi:integrase/recombinase XerC